jgi:hypothetical protein
MFLCGWKIALRFFCAALVSADLGMAAGHTTLAVAFPETGQGHPQATAEGPEKQQRQPGDLSANEGPKDAIEITGRVIDPDGKPVAGAKLYLRGNTSLEAPTYPVRATSGDDGRFTVTLAGSELDKIDPDDQVYAVLAVAKGYGCAWTTASTKAADDLTLRLVKDVPVKGRILDADGQPVAGANLTVTGVATAKGHSEQPGARGWVGPLPGQAEIVTAGGDGRFQVAGIGSHRVVSLRLEGRGIATAAFEAQGAAFEYQAALSRPIRGVVRAKDTRKPLPGVTVTCGLCEALTDQNGHYELLGVAKAARYGLGLKLAEGQVYLRPAAGVQDTPGLEALTCDIELVRGVVTVRGKITDKATGRPVAGGPRRLLSLLRQRRRRQNGLRISAC